MISTFQIMQINYSNAGVGMSFSVTGDQNNLKHPYCKLNNSKNEHTAWSSVLS
jgi:hypothetical protein